MLSNTLLSISTLVLLSLSTSTVVAVVIPVVIPAPAPVPALPRHTAAPFEPLFNFKPASNVISSDHSISSLRNRRLHRRGGVSNEVGSDASQVLRRSIIDNSAAIFNSNSLLPVNQDFIQHPTEERHPRYYTAPTLAKRHQEAAAAVEKQRLIELDIVLMIDPSSSFEDCAKWEVVLASSDTTTSSTATDPTATSSHLAGDGRLVSHTPLTSASTPTDAGSAATTTSAAPIDLLPLPTTTTAPAAPSVDEATATVDAVATTAPEPVDPVATTFAPAAEKIVTSSPAAIDPVPATTAVADVDVTTTVLLPGQTTTTTVTTTTSTTTTASAAAIATSVTASIDVPIVVTSSSTSVTSSATPSASVTPVVPPPVVPTWPAKAGLISAAYYPNWLGKIDVDFTKFDLIDFAFAVPDANFNVAFDSSTMRLLMDLVIEAHAANTKVLISIGGWTGSGFFSSAVATQANMNIFVNNIVQLVVASGVDGIDIDWEYPGSNGAPGNQVSSSDTTNFLTFLEMLKAALPVGQNRTSAAASHNAFIGANGSPIADVTAFAAVLDNLLVMNYDVWGASSTPGPNAPLSDACPNSQQPNANALSAIRTWTAAGMPASKIMMGVPAYGYISSSSATTLVHRRSTPAVGEKGTLHQQWYQQGHRAAALARTHARRAARKVIPLSKRSPAVFCAGNHSGKPCAGITNQTIASIPWNPLVNSSSATNSTGSTSGNGGVFVPGAGIGKLGDGDLSSVGGNQINFGALVSNGVIIQDSSAPGGFSGVNGYTRMWDTCSSTPYLVNSARNVVVTYDDPQSMQLKGALILAEGLGGANMWDIAGDYSWALTNAWRAGMGYTL